MSVSLLVTSKGYGAAIGGEDKVAFYSSFTTSLKKYIYVKYLEAEDGTTPSPDWSYLGNINGGSFYIEDGYPKVSIATSSTYYDPTSQGSSIKGATYNIPEFQFHYEYNSTTYAVQSEEGDDIIKIKSPSSTIKAVGLKLPSGEYLSLKNNVKWSQWGNDLNGRKIEVSFEEIIPPTINLTFSPNHTKSDLEKYVPLNDGVVNITGTINTNNNSVSYKILQTTSSTKPADPTSGWISYSDNQNISTSYSFSSSGFYYYWCALRYNNTVIILEIPRVDSNVNSIEVVGAPIIKSFSVSPTKLAASGDTTLNFVCEYESFSSINIYTLTENGVSKQINSTSSSSAINFTKKTNSPLEISITLTDKFGQTSASQSLSITKDYSFPTISNLTVDISNYKLGNYTSGFSAQCTLSKSGTEDLIWVLVSGSSTSNLTTAKNYWDNNHNLDLKKTSSYSCFRAKTVDSISTSETFVLNNFADSNISNNFISKGYWSLGVCLYNGESYSTTTWVSDSVDLGQLSVGVSVRDFTITVNNGVNENYEVVYNKALLSWSSFGNLNTSAGKNSYIIIGYQISLTGELVEYRESSGTMTLSSENTTSYELSIPDSIINSCDVLKFILNLTSSSGSPYRGESSQIDIAKVPEFSNTSLSSNISSISYYTSTENIIFDWGPINSNAGQIITLKRDNEVLVDGYDLRGSSTAPSGVTIKYDDTKDTWYLTLNKAKWTQNLGTIGPEKDDTDYSFSLSVKNIFNQSASTTLSKKIRFIYQEKPTLSGTFTLYKNKTSTSDSSIMSSNSNFSKLTQVASGDIFNKDEYLFLSFPKAQTNNKIKSYLIYVSTSNSNSSSSENFKLVEEITVGSAKLKDNGTSLITYRIIPSYEYSKYVKIAIAARTTKNKDSEIIKASQQIIVSRCTNAKIENVSTSISDTGQITVNYKAIDVGGSFFEDSKQSYSEAFSQVKNFKKIQYQTELSNTPNFEKIVSTSSTFTNTSDFFSQKTVKFSKKTDWDYSGKFYYRVKITAYYGEINGSDTTKYSIITTSSTYVIYSNAPTICPRKNQIGINSKDFNEEDIVLIEPFSDRKNIRIKNINKEFIIGIDGNNNFYISGAIIDGGSW